MEKVDLSTTSPPGSLATNELASCSKQPEIQAIQCIDCKLCMLCMSVFYSKKISCNKLGELRASKPHVEYSRPCIASCGSLDRDRLFHFRSTEFQGKRETVRSLSLVLRTSEYKFYVFSETRNSLSFNLQSTEKFRSTWTHFVSSFLAQWPTGAIGTWCRAYRNPLSRI